ncbi:MAG: MerR family transcriptional regulator [Candidatus Aminicenantes bacterium]|nr:MerR family transcriptional regulator [Candidatus Aminicenantes bacterium]
MNSKTFTRQELEARFHVSRPELEKWMKLKLLLPAGFGPNKTPLFSEDGGERIAHIQRLLDLGYGLEDVQKILKKVGLPQEELKKKKRKTPERFLTVGDLAEQSGVSPRTIKHWEDKGIIVPDMRSEGGFRLYSKVFVFLCQLIRDLQLFGYTLEDIKVLSGYYQDYQRLRDRPESLPKAAADAKLEKMLSELKALFDKIEMLKQGIARWEDLLKKAKKEVQNLKQKNDKRRGAQRGAAHA